MINIKFYKILKLLICIALFLFTLELSARVDDAINYRAPLWGPYTKDILIDIDRDNIKHNNANTRFEKWRINNHGFRGPNTSITKSPGTIRIVCLGASETFGLYESEGKEWPSQLRSLLDDFKRFEIINAAVPGLSLNQWRGYIQKYVLKFNPDMMILYPNGWVYAVQDQKSSNEKDQFNNISQPDQKRLQIPKKSSSSLSLLSLKMRETKTDIIATIRVYRKLKQTIKKVLPVQLANYYKLWTLSKQLELIENTTLNGENPIDTVNVKSLHEFEDDFQDVLQFVLNQNIDVIVSSYPALISRENIEEYRTIFLDHRRFFVQLSFFGMIEARDKFNHVIKRVTTRLRVPLIDNSMLLPRTTRYFADNVHYTNEGAQLVAENFFKYMVSRQEFGEFVSTFAGLCNIKQPL